MNPQLTRLVALERASDLRREAQRRPADTPGTTRASKRTSLRIHRTAGRFPYRSGLRAA